MPKFLTPVGVIGAAANGGLTVGTNTVSPTGGLWFGTDTNLYRYSTGVIRTDGALNIGVRVDSNLGYRHGGAGSPSWTTGTGTPEGAVTAPIGSIFSRTDGGTNSALYRKETGTGNTGWSAVATAAVAPVTSVDGRTGVVTLNDLYVDITGDTMTGTLTAIPTMTSWGVNRFGVDSTATVNVATAEGTFGVTGVQARGVKQGAGDLTATSGLRGLNAIADLDGTGNATEAIGVLATVRNLNAISTLTSAIGVRVESPGSGTNLITNTTGVTIKNQGRTGTAAAIGLNVHAQTGASTINIGAQIAAAGTTTLWLSSNADNTTAAAGLHLGLSRDTNLYRSAAATVRTDGSFNAGVRVDATSGFRHGSSTTPSWTSGTGTPEGAVTAPVGSLFSRTDGAAGTAVYRKEAGTGNTGWMAVTTAPADAVSSVDGRTGVVTLSDLYVNTTGDTMTGPLTVEGASNAFALTARVAGDTRSRLIIRTQGSIEFGDGTGLVNDTNLYRVSPDVLQTDDSFAVMTNLGIGLAPSASYRIHMTHATAHTSGSGVRSGILGHTWTPPSDATSVVHGLESRVSSSLATGVSHLSGSVYALAGNIYADGDGNQVAPLYAVSAGIVKGSGTGTITDARAFFAGNPVINTGTVTTAYGLYIATQKSARVTTGYGIYQQAAGDLNYFGGNVGVGIAPSPSHTMNIARGDAEPTVDSLTALNVAKTSTYATTEAGATSAYAAWLEMTKSGVGNATNSNFVGVFARSNVTGGNANAVIGAYFQARNSGTGTVTRLSALDLNPPTNLGAVTTSYGLYLANQGVAGIVTSYGARILAQANSTNTYGLVVGAATTNTLWLSDNANNITAAAGIVWGSSRDTNLYRSDVNTLKTDGYFESLGLRSGNTRMITETRTAPVVVGNAVELGSMTLANGAGFFDVAITFQGGALSTTKNYLLPVTFNQTNTAWQIARPISDAGMNTANDIALDINVTSATVSFRIRRTAGTTPAGVDVSILHRGVQANAWISSSTTSTPAAPTVYYDSTPLTQRSGTVAIGADTVTTQALRVETVFDSSSVVYGVNASPGNTGAGSLVGGHFRPYSTAATVASITGVLGGATYTGAGTLTTGIGLQAYSPSRTGSGTIATAIGVDVLDQKVTGVTTGYGINQRGASDFNYFAGNVGLATTPDPLYRMWSFVSATHTSGSGSPQMAARLQTNWTPAANATSSVLGALGIVFYTVNAGLTHTNAAATAVVGLNGGVITIGDGTSTAPINGVVASVTRGGGTGSTSIVRAFSALSASAGSGTVGTATGLHIEAQKTAGVTTGYGIYQGGTSDINQFNGAMSFGEAVNFSFGTTTGTKLGTASTQKLGFWNAAPVIQNTGWSVTAGYTASKAINPATTTLQNMANLLGTLVDALKSYGILG